MFRFVLAGLVACLLSACSDPTDSARDAVKKSLHEQGDFQFFELTNWPGDVVCGAYLQMDKWGESRGRRPFIYHDGETNIRPNRDQLAIFCSDAAAQALAERFGVTFDAEGHIAKVTRDFARLDEALEAFYDDVGKYPDNEQGLAYLVQQDKDANPLRKYRAGGYIDSIPRDPWGQAYQYDGSAWGRVKTPYRLWTLGADGTPGGEGINSDISVELLSYLQHVASLR